MFVLCHVVPRTSLVFTCSSADFTFLLGHACRARPPTHSRWLVCERSKPTSRQNATASFRAFSWAICPPSSRAHIRIMMHPLDDNQIARNGVLRNVDPEVAENVTLLELQGYFRFARHPVIRQVLSGVGMSRRVESLSS